MVRGGEKRSGWRREGNEDGVREWIKEEVEEVAEKNMRGCADTMCQIGDGGSVGR